MKEDVPDVYELDYLSLDAAGQDFVGAIGAGRFLLHLRRGYISKPAFKFSRFGGVVASLDPLPNSRNSFSLLKRMLSINSCFSALERPGVRELGVFCFKRPAQ